MKHFENITTRFFVIILLSLPIGQIFGEYEIDEWRFRPQIGIWFGPAAPVPGTKIAESLNTYLGGGMFFRFNIPSDNLWTELGVSYSNYRSDGPEKLYSVPYYAALSYLIPVETAVQFMVKGGVGLNYLYVKPEYKYNTHPILFIGTEFSFPAGKWVNIGLRGDYYFVYEKYLDAPKENPNFEVINGHFFNVGLMVNFNLVR